MHETVGQRILVARNEQAMRQIDLAELVGVSERSIQAYENDEVIPYRKMEDLAAVLGRSVAWLLHGDEAAKAPGDLAPLLEDVLVELREIKQALSNGRAPARKPTSRSKTKTTTRRRKS